MSDVVTDTSKALVAAQGDAVALPGEDPYQEALATIFFSDAAMRRPSCVVQPRTTEDVAAAMRISSEHGSQVTVRGGGLSSLCTADDAVLIDLSAHLDTAAVAGDRVRAGGGAKVGTILEALAPMSRVIPVGVVSLAGMGLATRGGLGYLTRSRGPTIDSLDEVELVLPGGDTLRLSNASTGDEADLWWAVRGCAPHFGVVTSATFRSHALGRVFAHRAIFDLDALSAFFEVAPSLPADTSLSAVLGPPVGSSEPVLFTYLVYAADDEAGMDRAAGYVREVATRASTSPLLELAGTYRYLDGLPPMSVPGLDGTEPGGPQPPVPGEPRAFMYSKCRFGPATLGAGAAEAVAERIRVAPTSFCRIDFQHTGGALGAVADDATAFWGRDSEWNIPWNSLWTESEGDRESCVSWARETADALDPFAPGVYSVELRPGFPETRAEVDAAFGGNLPRLRALKSTWDPNNVMGSYYPL
jgi:FAD/FMN-containing dehydrogenase